MDQPKLFWIDVLAATRDADIPSLLTEKFDVRTYTSQQPLETEITTHGPSCLFFDFDYPDRVRLARFTAFKERFPSIPMVIMTVQHSESLAVWAYRHGALDYLVKPIQACELRDCVARVLEIFRTQNSQQRRGLHPKSAQMPHDVLIASRSTKDKLSPAINFVKQHYNERIYSDAVARMCGMSATHFSRVFKQSYGLTFQDFLLRFRVCEARELLNRPGANIADVGYLVGFSDPSYFGRIFKRYVGVSPSEYIAKQSSDQESRDESVVADRMMTSNSQIVRHLANSLAK